MRKERQSDGESPSNQPKFPKSRRSILKHFSIGAGALAGIPEVGDAKGPSYINKKQHNFDEIRSSLSVRDQTQLADMMENQATQLLQALTEPLRNIEDLQESELEDAGISKEWLDKALLKDTSLDEYAEERSIKVAYHITEGTSTARLHLTKTFESFDMTIAVETEVNRSYAILRRQGRGVGLIIADDESSQAGSSTDTGSRSSSTANPSSSDRVSASSSDPSLITSSCTEGTQCQAHDICDRDICAVDCCTKCLWTYIYCCTDGTCYWGGDNGNLCKCPQECPNCEYHCFDGSCY